MAFFSCQVQESVLSKKSDRKLSMSTTKYLKAGCKLSSVNEPDSVPSLHPQLTWFPPYSYPNMPTGVTKKHH